MPTVTTHALGTFCWPELATSDVAGAKKFYTSLFGWQFGDSEVGPGMTYTIYTLNGRDVAAMMELQPEMVKMGMPPTWGVYVTVENADQSADKAKSLGATVLNPPMDVMEHGRMAVLQDPQGAVFSVWQAKNNIGVGVLNEPGSLTWTQFNAKDTAGAKQFYPALLGWKVQENEMPAAMGGGTYTRFMKADGPAGGMMPMPKEAPAPSHWLSYFAVANVDAAATKAATLGAKTHVPPTDIPGMGRFAVLADPQGATFAIVKFDMPA
jgi:predicted enzyme related to lactoylglutathione lyase